MLRETELILTGMLQFPVAKLMYPDLRIVEMAL